MTNLIALTGFAQSGKDSAAAFLVKRGFKRLAFADILRQSIYNLNPIVDSYVYCECDDTYVESAEVEYERVQQIVDRDGWDIAKVRYPEIRELLQRMGTEVGRELYGESFWVDRVMSQIEPGERYVITDARFPNEAKAVRELGGLLFRVQRPGVQAVNNHASEQVLSVDGVIPNTGTLEQLEANVLYAAGIRID